MQSEIIFEAKKDGRRIFSRRFRIDAKVKKVLKKIGIKNIGDFENINIRKIKKLNDLGEKYIQQLENALYDLGVDLMEDEEIINQCKKWRQNQALNIDYINNQQKY